MRFMRVLPLLPLALFFSACGGGGNSGLTTTGTNGQNQFAGGPLAITTASILPATLQGQQYSVTLVATNGQGALHWSIAPSSPTALFVNGLTIDPSTGIVSGTVNWSGTAGFVGTVTDSASPPHEAGANFTVVAYQKLQSAASQAITVNEFQDPIAVRTGIVGGFPPVSYRVSSGSIAPGLKFDSTGALVGEAYQQGSYQFTITGQDSFNPPETATQSFTLTVRPPPLTVNTTIPFRVTLNRPFSGKVVALGGTPPYSYALSFPANLPAGLSFDSSTGILSGTPTVNNSGYNGVATVTDSSSPAQTAGTSIGLTVLPPLGRNDSPATATPIDNGGYSASISPYIDPPNGVPTAGDHDYYKLLSVGGGTVHVETFAKRGNPNNPLDTVIEIVDANGHRLSTCRQPGDTSTTFAGSCINDDITTPTATQDSAIDFLVPGSDSTTTTFYVHVFDWRGDARPDMSYGLQVSGVIDPLQINPVRQATRGVAYSQQLTASHTTGTVTWSIISGSLPPGLSLSNGTISGTATTDGSYSFTLQASDAGPPPQIGTAQETIIVGEPVTITSSPTFPPACANQPYSFQVTTADGTGPYEWSFFSNNWPSIHLNQSTGTFSGTTGVIGTFIGNVSVLDAAGSTASQQVSLTVLQCP